MNSNGIFEFCATQSLPAELEKHRPKLLEISKLNEVDLDMAISQIISNFTFCDEALIPFEIWVDAAKLVSDVDSNDVSFIALNNFLKVKLWTGDKKLIKGLVAKGYTNFILTEELFRLRSLIEE